jgi:large subunit ribosomal protein L3
MAKERNLGLIGQKLGMTQLFNAEGKRLGVTVLELGPCVVVAKKVVDTDGYTALQLGFQDKKEKHTTKPELGHVKKANTAPKRVLREFRVSAETAAKYEVGATVSAADLFKEGDVVDCHAKTKGRGYQGVVRRWGFKGSPATHGHHEFFRHGGSIGNREFPGRVFKNRKMAGQYGNENMTAQNVKVAKVVAEKNLVLILGAIPGGPSNVVTLVHAVKTKKAAGPAAAVKAKK